MMRIDHSTI